MALFCEECRYNFQTHSATTFVPPAPHITPTAPDRPQTRKDVGLERGMAVTVGRLRPCPVFHHRFVALGHNVLRGAAGAAVLNAELMASEGLLAE